MGLSGKLVRQVEIKSDGDLFHELFRRRPHHISNICPHIIEGVDLHEGDWGTVGSVIQWNYIQDGKKKFGKEIVEAIDEENKSITFRIIEGDVLEEFRSFVLVVHVDTKGQNKLITWTAEYEKLKEDVPDPGPLVDLIIEVSKHIDTHHQQIN